MSPFETEMRHRLWWQVVVLVNYTLDSGLTQSLLVNQTWWLCYFFFIRHSYHMALLSSRACVLTFLNWVSISTLKSGDDDIYSWRSGGFSGLAATAAGDIRACEAGPRPRCRDCCGAGHDNCS